MVAMVPDIVAGVTWKNLHSPMLMASLCLHILLLLVVTPAVASSRGEPRMSRFLASEVKPAMRVASIRRDLAGNETNTTSPVVNATVSLSEDAEVLLQFKAALTSDPFNVTKYWKPIGKRQLVNPCKPWVGITCTRRRVTAIKLQNQSLAGPLVASLGRLGALQTLNLSTNHFSGPIPSFQLGAPSSLQVLDLGGNNLTGSLPQSLGDLTNLTSLVVSSNPFVGGDVPTSIGNLGRLRTLNLSRNNLTGTIPESLTNCRALTEIDLSGNRLQGAIPFNQTLTNLTVLHLQNNLLNGDFITRVGTFPMLEDVDLRNNQLIGTIPVTIGGVPLHESLLLGGNLFNGTIPDELGELALVKRIDLSENQFSGGIPEKITNCISLIELTVGSNNLTGGFSIPNGTLPALTTLNVSHNALNGSLPTLNHLVNLKLFDGSFNRFSGEVATTFVRFSSLQSLNVSSNRLSGEVPFFASHDDVTARSFLNNSALCGTILGVNCGGGDGLATSTIVYISLGSAAGVILLAVAMFFCVTRICNTRWNKGSKHSAQVSAELRLKLTPDEVLAATNGFIPSSHIGGGKFGEVYRGVLPGDTVVAVKRLAIARASKGEEVTNKALDAELEVLGHTRHRSLVKVLGYCSRPEMESLVLEFMPHGTLAGLLYAPQNEDSVNRAFDWSVRFKIALDIAEGLKYLHAECRIPVVHGDVKPSNILFDANMEAKVADFGVKRVFTEQGFSPTSSPSAPSVTTTAHGYTPADVAASGIPSLKGDVYSFGIIMLEMITGRDPNRLEAGQTLPQWVRATVANSKALQHVLDPVLMADLPIHQQKMAMLLGVALLCTRSEPQDRPQMIDVYKMLAHIRSKSNETSRRKGALMISSSGSRRSTSSAARRSASRKFKEAATVQHQPLPHTPSLSDWTPPSEV